MKATCALAAVVVALTAGLAAAQSPADAVKGFSIVLVEGSQQPGTSSDLPVPARAAIEDIRDFLPFKSFRLLDASWMVGATDVRSRLNGGDRDYEVAVAVTRQTEAKDLAVRFTLRDAPGARNVAAPEPDQLAEARRALELQNRQEVQTQRQRLQSEYAALEALRQKLDPNHPDVRRAEQTIARSRDRLVLLEGVQAESVRRTAAEARRTADEIQRREAKPVDRALIDTNFSMRVGETVVVGTSRVNGERALIALMTAVSK
jgi:hypothetical protein